MATDLTANPDVNIRIEGAVGRITLNRPEAMNALTYGMALLIDEALQRWADDDNVEMVIIDASGDQAFCAGGDIAELYHRTLASDLAYSRDFWRDEYRLNARIAGYPKPYVALMAGFVMGGGVGISAHGSHRIVTDNSKIAMPECAIGLIPDVGGTFILSRAPGHLGEYLGLSGVRMEAADAILAGFADFYVPADRFSDLVAALIETPEPAVIEQFAKIPPAGHFAAEQDEIDGIFGLGDVQSMARAMADAPPWLDRARKAVARNCPLSMLSTLQMIRDARSMATLEEALAAEYRFAWRALTEGEFMEGIRAVVIDKDRAPKWAKPGLADVSQADVDAMLQTLNENELTF